MSATWVQVLMGRDPLSIVIRSARLVRGEFCWPLSEALQVVDAFERLDRVILGVELWQLEDGLPEPTVLGWTEYEVPAGTWAERVAASSRLASEELLGHSGNLDVWFNLTWEDRGDPAS